MVRRDTRRSGKSAAYGRSERDTMRSRLPKTPEPIVLCNLYTVKASLQDLADHFGIPTVPASNAGEEVYPGTPGVVMREESGARVLQSMTWGFPIRLKTMKPGSKPKPVNNIADLAKGFWVGLARKPQWRCIIPVTQFAEAEGVTGAKTRTWFSVKGQPIFGWGGLWRNSDEWGPVYSGAMTDCNEAIRQVHDRMPVLLLPEEYDQWLHGTFDDLMAFQKRCFPDHLIDIDRTAEPWVKRKATAGSSSIV